MEHTFFDTPVDRPTAEMPIIIPGPRARAVASPAPTPSVAKRDRLADKHALVVGINYAPEPTGTAPYTTAMAEHLAGRAASVTVITGFPHYPSWSLGADHKWLFRSAEEVALPEGRSLTIRRARHYVPRKQTAITRTRYEASFLANIMTTRVQHRPNLVIAVTPSLGGAIAGARLARQHDSKFLIVVQELTAEAATQTGIRGGNHAARAAAWIEKRVLHKADHIAIVSDAFRDALHQYGVRDEKISLLPNWTHIRPTRLSQAECRRTLGWSVEPFTVVHTGNIGLKQDLGNLVEAARLCNSLPDLRFVIVGDGSQRAAIEAQASGLKNLAFVDTLDDEHYPRSLAAADLLVVNERPGVGNMSLPSKLTSYLSTGRPLIAAVQRDGATAQELGRTRGAALIVPPGDPVAFIQGVLNLREDFRRRAQMSALGQAYAEAVLDRSSAATRFDTLIDNCVAN
jgi:colanic acid biosynthesis glycosyl transferase WcaI